ncbi:MAG TPA: cytidine deaminase [bacterium]|nr:cytidine deaminase [bacterium]
MTFDELIQTALKQRESARADFSNFRVGAVLLTIEDRLFTGCNIEISSFGLTICAERVAVFKAISEGLRDFKTIFIASDSTKITPPCGACRQVLWELAGDIEVIMINCHASYQKAKMSDLLPHSFDRSFLIKNKENI